MQEEAGDASLAIGKIEIELVLNAIQPNSGKRAAVGQPGDTSEQGVARIAETHPASVAAGCRDNAKAHIGIRIAGFGVTLGLQEAARAEERDLREDGLVTNVELQVSDRLRIRRPPMRSS